MTMTFRLCIPVTILLFVFGCSEETSTAVNDLDSSSSMSQSNSDKISSSSLMDVSSSSTVAAISSSELAFRSSSSSNALVVISSSVTLSSSSSLVLNSSELNISSSVNLSSSMTTLSSSSNTNISSMGMSSSSDGVYWNQNISYGMFTDDRDGNVYRTVTIGLQEWMAENLNFISPNSTCNDLNPDYCEVYGRLYIFEDAIAACPIDWHLPSGSEWGELVSYIGGYSNGFKLKVPSYWPSDAAANDEYGFGILPGGYYNGGTQFLPGWAARFWTSTEESSEKYYTYHMQSDDDKLYYWSLHTTVDIGYASVRCLKNN